MAILKPEQSAFLKELPKCEHHLHIEGTLEPSLLLQLATKNNIKLPPDVPEFASAESLRRRYENFSSLDDFLHFYYTGLTVLITADDFELLAWNYFQQAAADGVVHAELSFDAQAHVQRGISVATVLAGLTAARERAKRELGISSEVICCFMRHLPPQECVDFFLHDPDMADILSQPITGIGLDSSELGNRPGGFEEQYFMARKLGLRVTAHSGEEAGPDYIQEGLDVLKVERIDHGLSLRDDPALMERVAREGILVTSCPLSNIVLRNATSFAELPIRDMLRAKVRFSLNSDDPAYFGGYVLRNYEQVQETFQLSVDEWDWVVRGAAEGSWCGQARKEEILHMIDETLGKWRDRL